MKFLKRRSGEKDSLESGLIKKGLGLLLLGLIGGLYTLGQPMARWDYWSQFGLLGTTSFVWGGRSSTEAKEVLKMDEVKKKGRNSLGRLGRDSESDSELTFQKPSLDKLKQSLTPEQYSCTQEGGTERAFHNKYWNNKEDGIYVDLITREPLFSSLDKYDSGSGWPSFTKPLDTDLLHFKKDLQLGYERTEIKSKRGDTHLGHVFNDGPVDRGGKRFCVNSASLDFIPLDQLQQKGLGSYLFLFAEKKKWQTALLAGGCFWGVEEILRKEKGIVETQVGYTGGLQGHPNYIQVKTGTTGHAEAVKVLFDPAQISYEKLLLLFFKLHDPTTSNRQGNDIGTQYRSAIFTFNSDQKKMAETVKARVQKSGAWKKAIVTEIVNAETFWPAEEYHQKYLQKKPDGYTCHFVRDLQF